MWAWDVPATGCMCLFCVWDVGCATANQHSRFNQLTSCSVQFPALVRHFLARQLPFSIISNGHAEASSRVVSLVKKTAHQSFLADCYTEKFMCIVHSTQSAKHVKSSACFFSSWDFSVTHGGMYDVKQHVNSKRHINKGRAISNFA